MDQILVIGGNGHVGGQVLSQLQDKGVRVRALVRNPDTARMPACVEMVRGDLAAPESLDACLEGVDAVFLVWTAPPATAAAAVERIAKHARRIVYLSAPIKTQHPLFQSSLPSPSSRLNVEIERLIEASGLQWTFLRPGMFAANAREWWAPQTRQGDVVKWPYLSAPTAPIDERDIAAVAVQALCEDGHSGGDYVLTGPESLTQYEQVATVGRAIGRSLRIEEMSPEEARREWLATWPPPVVNMLLTAWRAAIGQPAYVTSTVAEVTGRPARTFLNWATDHAAAFQG